MMLRIGEVTNILKNKIIIIKEEAYNLNECDIFNRGSGCGYCCLDGFDCDIFELNGAYYAFVK